MHISEIEGKDESSTLHPGTTSDKTSGAREYNVYTDNVDCQFEM